MNALVWNYLLSRSRLSVPEVGRAACRACRDACIEPILLTDFKHIWVIIQVVARWEYPVVELSYDGTAAEVWPYDTYPCSYSMRTKP